MQTGTCFDTLKYFAIKTQVKPRKTEKDPSSNTSFYNMRIIITICEYRHRVLLSRGGGAVRYRGGRTCVGCFAEEGCLFKTSACPWFVKEGYFFLPRYEVWGVLKKLQSTKFPRLWRRVTPEVTGLPSLLPLNRQTIITSKVKIACSRSSNVSVLVEEGVFFYWKKSAFFLNKGAFLAWNQCITGIFNFW